MRVVLRGLCLAAFISAGVASSSAQGPAYDVISVKPDKSGNGGMSINGSNDRYLATNVSVKLMMLNAWGLKTEEQIAGLPGWASSDRFDIEAKMDAEQVAALAKLKPDARYEQQRLMLQALLADRFGLKVHHETKLLPTYALLVAKSGLKMKIAAPDDPKSGSMNISNRRMTATGIETESIAHFLSSNLHRTVEDKTGLTDKYDFVLQWSGDEATDKAPEFPPLMTALEEQLGLKLQATKGPVDTIVVDQLSHPAEN